MTRLEIVIDHWTGLYGKPWGKLLHGASVEHPAKFSRKLIRRIYEHCAECGWLSAGDTVLDPFAGVGLGAFDALSKGLHWIGVELEPKWATFGQANIDSWRVRYPWLRGTARVVQGDSRRLCQVLAESGFALSVSSPAYATAQAHPSIGSVNNDNWGNEGKGIVSRRGLSAEYGASFGQLAAMPEGDVDAAIASPPFGQWQERDRYPVQDGSVSDFMQRAYTVKRQGESDGNLASMGMQDLDAAISSPPFLQATGGTNVTSKDGPLADGALIARHAAGNAAAHGYGQTEGQIQGMKEGEIDGVISSPTYEQGLGHPGNDKHPERAKHNSKLRNLNRYGGYGDNSSQVGTMTGETFWAASRQVIEQVYALLRPGGHAVWVCGDFVRGGKIVPFCDNWRKLCESMGFTTLHQHIAMKVRNPGTQLAWDGNHKSNRKQNTGFFRHIQISRAKARAHWELLGANAQSRYLGIAHWMLILDGRAAERTESRILTVAQALAYQANGKPQIEGEAMPQVISETVWCMTKER